MLPFGGGDRMLPPPPPVETPAAAPGSAELQQQHAAAATETMLLAGATGNVHTSGFVEDLMDSEDFSALPYEHMGAPTLTRTARPAVVCTAASTRAAAASHQQQHHQLAAAVPQPRRKARSGPKSRTSPYMGVSQYKRTGRWEVRCMYVSVADVWVWQ